MQENDMTDFTYTNQASAMLDMATIDAKLDRICEEADKGKARFLTNNSVGNPTGRADQQHGVPVRDHNNWLSIVLQSEESSESGSGSEWNGNGDTDASSQPESDIQMTDVPLLEEFQEQPDLYFPTSSGPWSDIVFQDRIRRRFAEAITNGAATTAEVDEELYRDAREAAFGPMRAAIKEGRWNKQEIARAAKLTGWGMFPADIAIMMSRSKESVKTQLRKLRKQSLIP